MWCSWYIKDYKDIGNLLVNMSVPKNAMQTLRNLYFIQSKIRNVSFWLEPSRRGCQRNSFFQLLLNKLIKMSSLYWIPVFMNTSLGFRPWCFASCFILRILLSTPPIFLKGVLQKCRFVIWVTAEKHYGYEGKELQMGSKIGMPSWKGWAKQIYRI